MRESICEGFASDFQHSPTSPPDVQCLASLPPFLGRLSASPRPLDSGWIRHGIPDNEGETISNGGTSSGCRVLQKIASGLEEVSDRFETTRFSLGRPESHNRKPNKGQADDFCLPESNKKKLKYPRQKGKSGVFARGFSALGKYFIIEKRRLNGKGSLLLSLPQLASSNRIPWSSMGEK